MMTKRPGLVRPQRRPAAVSAPLDIASATSHNAGVQRATSTNDRLPAPRLSLYGLAAAGGVVGYAPLLTLLLPMRLERFSEAARYDVLAACGITGAVAAGLANIAFGWLGDWLVARGRGRRGLLLAGVIATMVSFAIFHAARGALEIVAAIIIFQIAVNIVVAQVGAIISDEVPSDQKGTAAALLTLGNPLAAGATALIVAAATTEEWCLAIVAMVMAGCILPLLVVAPPDIVRVETATRGRTAMRRRLAITWTARLLMQVASSGVGLYLFFYLKDLHGGRSGMAVSVARLLFVGTLVPVPIAIVLGRWSDEVGRRKPFLAGTALLATLGLVSMALVQSWTMGAIAYVAFATGVAVFIALNTGHAMLLLPAGGKRGRDLGILNLANTIPQIVAPILAWGVRPAHGFAAALAIMAAITLLSGVLPLLVGDGDGECERPRP